MSSIKDDMSDEEIVEAIQEAFDDDGRVKSDYIKIEFSKGKPVINGRVASDDQVQIVDEIMSDVLEIEKYENKLWVDDELSFENVDSDEMGELSFDEEENLDSEEGYEDEEEKH